MLEKKLTIINRLGLHARAATKLVQLVQEFENAEVYIQANDVNADAKSIMDVLMLAASQNTEVTICIQSSSEKEESDIFNNIKTLIDNRFDESE